MGNQSIENSQGLKFIQQLEDHHFGQIDIFRSQDGRFIMKSQRTHVIGDARHKLFHAAMSWIMKQGQEYIVPIMHVEHKTENGLCIQIQASYIYNEYYNFTLLDLARAKKDLEEPEIWFIFQSLLKLAVNLRRNKLAAKLQIDNIFITLKGIPCIYYHLLLSLEESINQSEYSMSQQIAIILLQMCTSQEAELLGREPKVLLQFVSRVYSKNKLLGRMIKQVLNRQKNQQEMLEEIQGMISKNLIHKYDSIKLSKFRYALPQTSRLKSFINKQNKISNPIQLKPKNSVEKKGIINKIKQSKHEQSAKINEAIHNKEETLKILKMLSIKKQQNKQKMQMIALKKQQCQNHKESSLNDSQQKRPFSRKQQKVVERSFSVYR